MGVTVFTKEELAEFLIKHIQEEEPGVKFDKCDEGELLYNVQFAGDEETKAVMNFDNIWIAYQRTNDLNCVVSGLNSQLKAIRMSYRWKEEWDGFREDHVYPVLRPKHYATSQPDEAGRMLFDSMAEGLDTLFMERRDGLCLFLNKEMVPQSEVTQWKRIAYDNLRKRGWFTPEECFPALNVLEGGKIHVFTDADHPFQLQFFLKDMREKAMPSSFLVGFPSYDMAIALTVEDGISTAASAKELAVRSGLAKFMHLMYFHEPRPLSVDIYWVHGSAQVRVYRQPEPRLSPKRARKIG